MALFSKAENTSSFLKMGLMGFAGSGKTYTATSVAIGLHKLAKSTKPIFFLDTETGSDWVKPRVEAAGIELYTAKTRAFRDLVETVPEAEASASFLVVDSLTHFWVELTDTYMRTKKRTRLQFEDWSYLKAEWRKFTDLYVNSNLHIIVCGRAGFEYDYNVDEETGKKNLEKTGIKMKAEGEMGYESSLLVLMEREMDMATKTNRHYAKVLKDRSTLLDGKEFPDPTFETFLPHIQLLNLGGRHLGVDTTRTSVSLIPADVRDNRATQRKIVLDEIESLIVIHYPGQSAEDKKTKKELLRTHFAASWTEMDAVMPLERLRKGYDTLHFTLEGTDSRYHQERLAEQMNDELPGDLAPPKQIDRREAELDRLNHQSRQELAKQRDEARANLAPPKQIERIEREKAHIRPELLDPSETARPDIPTFLDRRTAAIAAAKPAPDASTRTQQVPARIQRNLDRLKVRAPELAPKDEPKPDVPYWEAALAAE